MTLRWTYRPDRWCWVDRAFLRPNGQAVRRLRISFLDRCFLGLVGLTFWDGRLLGVLGDKWRELVFLVGWILFDFSFAGCSGPGFHWGAFAGRHLLLTFGARGRNR